MKEELLLYVESDEPIVKTKINNLVEDTAIADIADVFENLSGEKAVRCFRCLPKAIASDVFSYIETDQQQAIIEALTDKEVGNIINDLYSDDAVDLIEEMPARVVKRLLKTADTETRKTINQLLMYPENSAGSIMTVEFVSLHDRMTVADAFERIRAVGIDKETIYTCYVRNKERLLIGVVSARDLLLANPTTLVTDIMADNFHSVHTKDDKETVAAMFRKYRPLALPVTDSENQLVGIITVDDIMDIMEKENTRDIEKMAALVPSTAPYLKTNVFRLSFNRLPWLIVLMLMGIFVTSSIIQGFENSLEKAVILAAFMPMLMGTGGNSGAQVSTLIVRSMALNETKMRDVLRVWWKEVRVALICGLFLGAIALGLVLLLNQGADKPFMLALTVSASLCLTIILAKSVGCLLPILAKRCKLDPAVMATPFITTIVDISALVIYFGFATLMMGI